MVINIYTLQNARKRWMMLQDILQELNYVHNSYHSPNLKRLTGSVKKSDTDPTASAFHKAEKLRELYETLYAQHIDEQLYIFDKIQDPEVRRIITIHYFAGQTWKNTCTRNPYKKVSKYLEEHEKDLNT